MSPLPFPFFPTGRQVLKAFIREMSFFISTAQKGPVPKGTNSLFLKSCLIKQQHVIFYIMAELKELSAIQKQIVAGQRKLQRLKLEQQQISKEIATLRLIRQDVGKKLQDIIEVYKEIHNEIETMIELIPFTDEEKENLRVIR
jgi:cell division protein FtsB